MMRLEGDLTMQLEAPLYLLTVIIPVSRPLCNLQFLNLGFPGLSSLSF